MVGQNLVAMEKVIVGKVATITCAHGDTTLAEVEVEQDEVNICVGSGFVRETTHFSVVRMSLS